MSVVAPAAEVSPSRQVSLAVACALTWTAAVWSAQYVGVWPAVGGAAILLAAVALGFEPTLRTLLRPNLSLLLIGTVAGTAMAAGTLLGYPLLSRSLPSIAGDMERLYAAFRTFPSALVALALGPIVIGEDLVWRGVVQGALGRRFGAATGVLLAGSAYALAQLPLGSPVLGLVALGCGILWGALRAATGSLVPTLIAHLLWDLVVLLGWPLDAL